jgi:pimeloyl-ACP methyl ester carboxylesterase
VRRPSPNSRRRLLNILHPERLEDPLPEAALRNDTVLGPNDAATSRDMLAPAAGGASVDQPETRFAWNGDVALAYQMIGSGERELLYLPGILSNVDLMWDWPEYARFLRRLNSFARLILMDRRGYGSSERFSPDAVAPLEVLVDDVLVVLDEAGVGRVAVFAYEEANFLAALLAASRPERVSHLVLLDPSASWTRNEDLPWEWTRERWEEQIEWFRRDWGNESDERRIEEVRWAIEHGQRFDEQELRW